MTVNLLHISKTGGSALRRALLPHAEQHGLVAHGHWLALPAVPAGERVAFLVRHPVSRFVSAFNSRLRMGRPLTDRPWSEAESRLFAHFRTPNELAEGLSSADERIRGLAVSATLRPGGIGHVNLPMTFWLHSLDELERRREDIVFVGFQERLDDDFEVLKRLLGLPPGLALPADPVLAHATPPGFSTELSELGTANVLALYAEDVAIYEYLLERHPA